MPSERYVDAGELARGGMGVIHKVISRAILREEAMKLISPSFATTPGAHARFLEEAQIHGQLEHPNILPVHDLALDEEGRPVYFTMQLAHGKTLRKLFEEYPVAERFGPPLERLLRILVHVCDAVSFAHTRGVIHCDIKPDNIMVASHGRTYLLDWGCAKLKKGQRPSGAGGSRSASNVSPDESHVFGTFAYMAPEQANGDADAIDERTDVFALGGLLYKFLTNRAPFFASHDDESMELARRGDVRPPGEVFENAQLPSELCRIALKALAKDPNDRYQSADAFKEEIERSIRWGVWFEARVFPAGSLVVKEGDPADAAYIVKRGTAEAFKMVSGRREVLRRIGPDESIGEAALLSDATRTASVVALEDLYTVVITRESLERELARDSWVGALVRSLASRFRDRDAGLSAERAAR
jgi:serine/threonine-protein kinase